MNNSSKDLLRNIEIVKHNLQENFKDSAKKIFDKVVELSPSVVDNQITGRKAPTSKGEFINNWFPALNSIDYSTTDNKSDEGKDSKERISVFFDKLGSASFFDKDFSITLSNSVDYAFKVEYLGWKNTLPYAPVNNALRLTPFYLKGDK